VGQRYTDRAAMFEGVEPALAGRSGPVDGPPLAPEGYIDPEAVSEALRALADLFVRPRDPVTVPHMAPVSPHGVSRQRKVEKPESIKQAKPESWSNDAVRVGENVTMIAGRNERREKLKLVNRGAADLLLSATDDVADRTAWIVAPGGPPFDLSATGPVYGRAAAGEVEVRVVQEFYGEVI
jgi:hypothetical protein